MSKRRTPKERASPWRSSLSRLPCSSRAISQRRLSNRTRDHLSQQSSGTYRRWSRESHESWSHPLRSKMRSWRRSYPTSLLRSPLMRGLLHQSKRCSTQWMCAMMRSMLNFKIILKKSTVILIRTLWNRTKSEFRGKKIKLHSCRTTLLLSLTSLGSHFRMKSSWDMRKRKCLQAQ